MPLRVTPFTPQYLAAVVQSRAGARKRRRRTLRRPPKALLPHGPILEYQQVLHEIVDVYTGLVREILVPALSLIDQLSPVPTRADNDNARLDAPADETLARAMRQLRERVRLETSEQRLIGKVKQVGERVSRNQRREFEKQVKTVIGVYPMVRDSFMREQMGLFVRQNVDLIQSIPEQSLQRVESLVNRSVRQGIRVEQMREKIAREFEVTTARADLIARDQVLKFHGELTQLRQREAGINTYIWDTSKDERVRGNPAGKYPDSSGDHYSLDGNEYSWDDPPVVNDRGDRAHPGEDFQCRCQALPVIRLE
jgi:SPP1 gp7 family putative phage head morphogenesis protein